MGEQPRADSSLVVLSAVLGVVVVIGAVGILAVAGLFMYRSRAAAAEKMRVQAMRELQKMQLELESSEQRSDQENSHDQAEESDPSADQADQPLVDDALPPERPRSVKPGAVLQAQRPVHWDDVEVIDVLDDSKVKVRWLSGEPGEDVIALELVRLEEPLAN
jgi:hypothetical protein